MSCCGGCPAPCPGYLLEPYHIPGYSGHQPTWRTRYGLSFGAASRAIMEDPCVGQAPCPVLAPPLYCPPCCPQASPCCPPRCMPCCAPCCDLRAHYINRGPYMCPCPTACPDPDCCNPCGPCGPRCCGMPVRRCC